MLLLPVLHPHSLNTRGTKALRDPVGTFQTRRRCDGLGDGEHLRRGTPKPCRTSPGTTEAGKGGCLGYQHPRTAPREHTSRRLTGTVAAEGHGPPPSCHNQHPLKAPVLLSHAAHPAPPRLAPTAGSQRPPRAGSP